MATKILITEKNSIWGVIVNPQSSNTYRHALSFWDTQTKTNFINKELFGGKDYKALLASQPETSFVRQTATNGLFVISPDQYPNESFASLLNKDFCIIEEDGIEEFYTLSAMRDKDGGNTIIYTAELDIFFTYDIKDGMFNDQPTRLERGMLDRFWKSGIDPDGNEHVYNLLSPSAHPENPQLPIRYLPFDNPFYNTEPDVDSNISAEGRIPTGKEEPFVPSVAHLVVGDAATAQVIDDVLNASTWNTFFTTLTDDGTVPWADETLISVAGRSDIKPQQVSYKDLQNEDPFAFHSCIIAGVGKVKYYDEALKDYVVYQIRYRYNDKEYGVYPFPKAALSDGATLKNTYTPLPYHPFTNLKDLTKDHMEFSLADGGTLLKTIFIDFKSDYDNLPLEQKPLGLIQAKTTGIDPEKPYLTVTNNSINNIKENELPFEVFPSTDYLPLLGHTKPWTPELETKLLLSPYRKLVVKGASKNALELAPQFFRNTGNILFRQSHGYLPEAYSNWILFTDYNTQYAKTSLAPASDKSLFTEISNYNFPTETSAWSEYIAQNRAQLNTTMGISGAGIGLGILGTLAAPLTGGASLALTGASIGGLVSSTKAIASQAAQVKDIQNSPDKLNGTGSTLALDISLKSLKPTLREYSIDPQLKKLIAQYFFKYGYNLAEELFNINDFLKTRRHFNYIKANETLENISLQVAPEVKQLINDTLAGGLTVWHVTTAATFKGIKNYKEQNLEESLGLA